MKKDLQLKTIELRKLGHSVKELHEEIGVSKSTISRWIQAIPLSQSAQKRLNDKSTKARIKAEETIREKTKQKNIFANNYAEDIVSLHKIDRNTQSIICSMIYFCEGAKSMNNVTFVNSDPQLIALFLKLLRSSFSVKEEKIRILMQLHDYHDEKKQRSFWSKITAVPTSQFHRSYIKESNHFFKKEGYQGCVMVRYYDSSLARKLSAIAKTFMERYK